MIKRSGLESVNPVHVNGASSKLAQKRSTSFACEDDFCNSWSTDNWPLPPIVIPRKKRDASDYKDNKTENLQCVVCNANSADQNEDCFNNAASLGIQSCPAG